MASEMPAHGYFCADAAAVNAMASGSQVSTRSAKQSPDQLHGHGLVALRTLIPLQAVSERLCVGDREGARRGEWFSHESFLQAPPRTMAPSPRSLFVSRFSVNKTNGRTRFRLRLWPAGRIDFHHEIRQEQRRLRAD